MGGDRTWISNRELGVLLLEPRAKAAAASASRLFSQTPFPFSLPLLPVDISQRDVLDTWFAYDEPLMPEDMGWYGGWNVMAGWRWEEQSGWVYSAETAVEDEEEYQGVEWPHRKRDWWFSAP